MDSPAAPASSRWRLAAFGLLVALALGVGLFSLRFALPGQPLAPPLANLTLQRELLVLHAVSAALALMLGPWQFSRRLRARRPGLHRRIGWAYAASLLVGGLAGLPLAVQAGGGLTGQLGFGVLGVLWLYVTAVALIHVRARRVEAHRRWMLRSYALTCAAISLRLQLGLGSALGYEVDAFYMGVAWTCWVPNALLAELWLWSRREMLAAPAQADPSWQPTQLGAD